MTKNEQIIHARRMHEYGIHELLESFKADMLKDAYTGDAELWTKRKAEYDAYTKLSTTIENLAFSQVEE